jgi:hypothetical protein
VQGGGLMNRKGVVVWTVSVLCLLLAWTVGVPAQDKPGGTPLSGAEMRALYDNGALLDWQDLGNRGSVALVRNGLAFQVWVLSAGVGDMDKGRWRIDGDTICFQWGFSRFGVTASPTAQPTCFRHYSMGGNRYEAWAAEDGARRGSFTLRK